MALPTDRASLIEHCLRKCGKPVITINIAPEQLEDCISDALQFFQEYNLDAQERTHYVHTITQTNKDNKYIELPDNIISVVGCYGWNNTSLSSNLFNAEYYITADAILGLTGGGNGLEQYFLTKQALADMNWLLNPTPPMRFRIHTRRLYIDMDWDKFTVGNTVLIECYAYIDPNVYQSIWSNWQLRDLAAAYVKKQWADNIRKFNGILPSGLQLNGEGIYAEAVRDIEEIKSQWIMSFSEPLGFYMA